MKVSARLIDWNQSIVRSNDGWKANNIHIDEICDIDDDRDKWISKSFYYLQYMHSHDNFRHSRLILFLHIDLTDSSYKQEVSLVNDNFINKNLDEFTPPSFNFMSTEYFETFHQQLTKCKMSTTDVYINTNTDCYFRTCFDEDEEVYSRELYIFCK